MPRVNARLSDAPGASGKAAADNTPLLAVLGLVFTPLSVIALLRTRSWNWIRVVSLIGVLLLVLEGYTFLKLLAEVLAMGAHMGGLAH